MFVLYAFIICRDTDLDVYFMEISSHQKNSLLHIFKGSKSFSCSFFICRELVCFLRTCASNFIYIYIYEFPRFHYIKRNLGLVHLGISPYKYLGRRSQINFLSWKESVCLCFVSWLNSTTYCSSSSLLAAFALSLPAVFKSFQGMGG